MERKLARYIIAIQRKNIKRVSSEKRAFEAGSPQLYISGTALVSGSVRLPSAATVTSSPGANYLWASGTNLYWDDTKVNSGNFYITGGSYSASTGNLTIEQTSQPTHVEGVEVSSSGFKLNTGMGWGVDVSIVLIVVAALYIGKKYVGRHFAKG